MDLISVIVPIYKVEAYLDRCISSIVEQTYTNLEIILVDDGSPDNCPAMCDAWAAKDPRIKVIHKENGGLSDARNAGMDIATGDYIGFVDSDDFISCEMYESLLRPLQNKHADIAACGVKMIFEDGTPPRSLTVDSNRILNRNEALAAVIQESWLKQPVWYKLYRAFTIKNIRFPVGKYHEDVFWTYRAVSQAATVSIIPEPYYFYTQRQGSIMNEKYSMKRLDAIEAKQERLAFVQENFSALTSIASNDLAFSCMYHCQAAIRQLNKAQRKKAIKYLSSVLQSCPMLNKNELSLNQNLWINIAKINLPFACRIRNLLKIGQ